MTSLQGYAVNVKDSGIAMGDASSSLSEAFNLVERVTSKVLENIGGISSSVTEIRGVVSLISDISTRLTSESERLDAEVAAYRIEVDSAADSGYEAAADKGAAADEAAAAGEAELLSASIVDDPADQSS